MLWAWAQAGMGSHTEPELLEEKSSQKGIWGTDTNSVSDKWIGSSQPSPHPSVNPASAPSAWIFNPAFSLPVLLILWWLLPYHHLSTWAILIWSCFLLPSLHSVLITAARLILQNYDSDHVRPLSISSHDFPNWNKIQNPYSGWWLISHPSDLISNCPLPPSPLPPSLCSSCTGHPAVPWYPLRGFTVAVGFCPFFLVWNALTKTADQLTHAFHVSVSCDLFRRSFLAIQ